MTVQGREVEDAFAFMVSGGTGTCFGLEEACLVEFAAGTRIQVTGTEGGDRRVIDATSDSPGAAIFNYTNGEILLRQFFESDDFDVELRLDGIVGNYAPTIELGDTSSLEVACGNALELTADVRDPDGPDAAVDTVWFVDGEFAASGGSSIMVDLGPGEHSVTVRAIDPAGGFGEDTLIVHVEADESAPTISVDAQDVCLWPPNHGLVGFSAEDFGIAVLDDCDPALAVEFTAVASSQPDNGTGDGNTDGDAVATSDFVCVRAERAGGDKDGRSYLVEFRAVDAAGNTSTGEVAIRVPHDQSPGNRCSTTLGTALEEGDPRCEEGQPQTLDVRPLTTSNGCKASGGDRSSGLPSLALLLCVAVLRRRRRE